MNKAAGSQLLLFLYLTRKCNLRCRYCFVEKGAERMSLRTVRRALDFSTSLGYRNISLVFFGGEPLLEWDLLKAAVGYSKKDPRFTRWTVSTNGLLLDDSKLDYIEANGISLGLSLDGARKEQETGRPAACRSSFSRLEEKLRLAAKHMGRISTQVRMTVLPACAGRLHESLKYVLEAGFAGARINIVPEVFSSAWTDRDLAAFDRELKKIAVLTAGYFKKGYKLDICFNADLDHYQLFGAARGKKYSCCAGKNMLAVLPNGDLYPCYFMAGLGAEKDRFKIGNVRDNGIKSARHPEYAALNENKFLSCPTWNYALGGDVGKTSLVYAKLYRSILGASALLNRSLGRKTA